jgi:NitT/TauT family transport system substrate-binding protein
MNALLVRIVASIALAAIPGLTPARAADKIVIGTDWRAEAEHGGLYQALATGIYARAGLDVEIRQGGPNLNQAQLLAAGRYDFSIQSNSFEVLNFVRNDVPLVVVAAAFQKDPQVLIAHEGAGNDTLEAMRGKPILISAASRDNFWQFLKARYGFVDEQIRPYTYNLAPFLADKHAIMQGYVTSEPFAIEQATGEKPRVILLADQGYQSYAAMIATTEKTIATRPDVVRRFVAASMAGWKSYLEDDPAPANALIMKDNPEMTAVLLGHARDGIKAHHLVDGGDAATLGLGAMSDKQWQGFFDFTTKAGVYPATMDYRRAYSLAFVHPPTKD